MFEMFFISTVFFKSSRINLIVRKGKIICYVMRDLPQKKLRRVKPFAPAVQYPYVNCNGVYQYPPELLKKMESFMITELTQRMDKENIYHE